LRTFKLTRVKKLKVTNKHFTVRDNLPFPLNTTEDENQKLVAMKFKIEPEMTYRVFDDFFEEITEKLPDGSYIISVKWPMDSWVFGFILSFGEFIEVLKPKSLRKTLKSMIAKIGKKYL
jgi:predicted DNA-binding transcriptional regulator YafY